MIRLFDLLSVVKNRGKSEADYFVFEKRMAEMMLPEITNYISDQVVLDLAGGRGGYTAVFSKQAKKIYLVDLKIENNQIKNNMESIKADALNLPFEDNFFDFIFCSSLIEHLDNQPKLISEIYRVLKKDGTALISFPPFYSLIGGHQIKPFHYLPEKLAIKLAKKFKKIPDQVTAYKNLFDSFGLYKTTIKGVKKLIKKSDFKLIRYNVRFLPINLAKIPLLGEFFSWHVQFWVKK